MKMLTQLDLDKKTIVMSTSNHAPQTLGMGAFRHSDGQEVDLKDHQLYLWEGGIRVPGIFRWPDKLKPPVESTPIGFVDYLPTFASLCDCEVPTDRAIDGIDFPTLLTGRQLIWKKPLHWRFHSPMAEIQSVMRDGNYVRTSDWTTGTQVFYKGTRHIPKCQRTLSGTALTHFRLFDIEADAEQQTNLANKLPKRFNTLRTQ